MLNYTQHRQAPNIWTKQQKQPYEMHSPVARHPQTQFPSQTDDDPWVSRSATFQGHNLGCLVMSVAQVAGLTECLHLVWLYSFHYIEFPLWYHLNKVHQVHYVWTGVSMHTASTCPRELFKRLVLHENPGLQHGPLVSCFFLGWRGLRRSAAQVHRFQLHQNLRK